MNGIINVYKESGITSFQAVARLRRITGVKKVGHTGTLDPMAEGVLPICLGYATRFAELITAGEKQYIAKFTIGNAFDSYDTTGAITDSSDKIVSEGDVVAALNSFIGVQELTIPAFSAKKINGVRAYALARDGQIQDAGVGAMNIHSIKLISYEYPHGEFVVDCAKGTYVRSIIHEMGLRLGTFAAMSGLIRSKNGSFSLSSARKFSEIEELASVGELANIVIAVQDAVSLPKAVLSDVDSIKRLQNGVSPYFKSYSSLPTLKSGDECLIFADDDKLLALAEYVGGDIPLKLSKVLV